MPLVQSLPWSWLLAGAALMIGIQAVLIAGLISRHRANARRRATLEERLRFESVLSQLSAGLIDVPAAAVDKALRQSLGEVVGVLGGDRGALDEYEGAGRRVRISWTSPGVEDPPQILDAARFPWTLARLQEHEIVRFSRTEELPEAASTDRAAYESAGTRSHVSLPLQAGAAILGALSLDSVQAEQAWSDEIVDRLRLVSEAFANALERRRMEVSLAQRLTFGEMLSSLSTTFSAVSPGDFDREVQRGLRRIADGVDVDRGALIELSRDGAPQRTWTTDDGMTVDGLPWTMAMVAGGRVVSLARIDDLPDEAAVDRRSCESRHITSQIALPLLVGGVVVGALVFATVRDERSWERDGLLQVLQLVGEVFANALSRQEGDDEMQRLRQELAHIGRVSAMGELTASLAHELNQPLTAILNNAHVAQHRLAADTVDIPDLREILADIVADDKRAVEVIRRLRSLLQKGDLEYVPLDLNEVVTEVARLVMNDAAVRNVSIRLDLAPVLPRVRGDRIQLQQVVLNLVLNGLDAMRESAAGDRTLVIRTSRESAAVVAGAVRDTGPGIAAKDAPHIFEPLYTTKTNGIGMGLAITRTIVGAHGGRVTAANNTDGGATFQFTLPVDKAAA